MIAVLMLIRIFVYGLSLKKLQITKTKQFILPYGLIMRGVGGQEHQRLVQQLFSIPVHIVLMGVLRLSGWVIPRVGQLGQRGFIVMTMIMLMA